MVRGPSKRKTTKEERGEYRKKKNPNYGKIQKEKKPKIYG